MKKMVLLLTVSLLLAMACTCPMFDMLNGTSNSQDDIGEVVSDLTIDLSDAATEGVDQLAESLPTDVPDEIPTQTASPTIIPEPSLGVGSMMLRDKDSMEMMYVPAGSFMMGSSTGETDESPVHEVYLDAFWIDKYEVTNAQYQQCVEDDFCVTLPVSLDSHAHESYYDNPEFANYPVIYVGFYQAFDYCLWAGDRNGLAVPTEAQWEKAAKGTDERVYPWGNQTPDCSLVNEAGCNNDTVAVGSYSQGASPYGVMDMAGNVWEWTRDYYDENYYRTSPRENPEGPEEYSDMRVIRGGSFGEGDDNQRTTRRYSAWEGSVWFSLGFRCAITADGAGQ